MKIRYLILLLLVAMATGIAACGGSDGDESGGGPDEQAIEDVFSRLEDLSREGNGGAICRDLLTPKLVESIQAAAESERCGTEIRENTFAPDATVEVESTKVTDDSAVSVIRLRNDVKNRVELVKFKGEWRIRSFQLQE